MTGFILEVRKERRCFSHEDRGNTKAVVLPVGEVVLLGVGVPGGVALGRGPAVVLTGNRKGPEQVKAATAGASGTGRG